MPYIHWDFVAYTKKRMEQVKYDWQSGHFPTIPGEHKELTPCNLILI